MKHKQKAWKWATFFANHFVQEYMATSGGDSRLGGAPAQLSCTR